LTVTAATRSRRRIVREADGSIVPISYGFARSLALGNVTVEGLQDAFGRWRTTGYPHRRLCRGLFEEIAARPSEQLVNWHERIVAASLTGTAVAAL
jgi:hypothetical protein